MKRNISDGRKNMKILDFFKNLFVKKPEFDRNYHHYVMTDHCRIRMKERRILYKDINLCMKYGVLVGNQIVLDETDIPEVNDTYIKCALSISNMICFFEYEESDKYGLWALDEETNEYNLDSKEDVKK